jgi:MFS family permease
MWRYLPRGWRTDLPRLVLLLQVGNAADSFGYGLILPFEIIYLHHIRGFATATAGLVLAAAMGTAAVATPPSGALLDRFRAKPVLIAGCLATGLGYAELAFVDRPWQAFVGSVIAGAGLGVTGTAYEVLSLNLVTGQQRASLFALGRVAGNFGIGSGATIAGFIVASVHGLRAFQALYLFDAITCVAFALIVLVAVPNPRPAKAAPSDNRTGFRAVARDRVFLILIAANIVLLAVGPALLANILPPFALAHTPVGPGDIGVLFFLNAFFIVVAQIPAARVVKGMRRAHAFAATSGLWAIALLAVLLATLTRSPLAATTDLAGVAIVIAIGECVQSVVLGPVVADLAPPHLLGRYMSLYSLTFATSPDAVWWGGALVAAMIGAGFLLSGDRIPEPSAATASNAPGDLTPDPA